MINKNSQQLSKNFTKYCSFFFVETGRYFLQATVLHGGKKKPVSVFQLTSYSLIIFQQTQYDTVNKH